MTSVALSPSAAAADTPLSSAEVRDRIGVNVHASYYDTAYGDWSRVLEALRDLGVIHLRDGAQAADDPGAQRSYEVRIRQATAAGHRFDLIMGQPGQDPARFVEVALRRLREGVEALEGPNEVDLVDPRQFPDGLRAYQGKLARAVRDTGPGAPPLLAPSVGRWASFGTLGPLTSPLPLTANIHYYENSEQPTGEHLAKLATMARSVTGRTSPVMITETGYFDRGSVPGGPQDVEAGAPELVVASYTLRTVFEALKQGVARTYLYELLDEKPDPSGSDAQQHFGLLRNDFSPKPAFTALKRTLDLIGPPNAAHTGDVPLQIRGGSDVRHVLMRTATGGLVLALWREVSLFDTQERRVLPEASTQAVISMPELASGTVLDPTTGRVTNVPAEADGRQLKVNVSGTPLLITLTTIERTAVPASTEAVASAASSDPTPPTTTAKVEPADEAAVVQVGSSGPGVLPPPAQSTRGATTLQIKAFLNNAIRGVRFQRQLVSLPVGGAPQTGSLRFSLYRADGRGPTLETKVVPLTRGQRLTVHLRSPGTGRPTQRAVIVRLSYRPTANRRYRVDREHTIGR